MSDLARQMREVCDQHYHRGWWHGFAFGAGAMLLGAFLRGFLGPDGAGLLP